MIEIRHFGEDMKELLQEKVWVINVLGQISFRMLCDDFKPIMLPTSFFVLNTRFLNALYLGLSLSCRNSAVFSAL